MNTNELIDMASKYKNFNDFVRAYAESKKG